MEGAVTFSVAVIIIKYMIKFVVTFLGHNDKAVKSRKINNRIKDILQKQEHERV